MSRIGWDGEVREPLGDTGYHAPAAFGHRPFEGRLALKRLGPSADELDVGVEFS